MYYIMAKIYHDRRRFVGSDCLWGLVKMCITISLLRNKSIKIKIQCRVDREQSLSCQKPVLADQRHPALCRYTSTVYFASRPMVVGDSHPNSAGEKNKLKYGDSRLFLQHPIRSAACHSLRVVIPQRQRRELSIHTPSAVASHHDQTLNDHLGPLADDLPFSPTARKNPAAKMPKVHLLDYVAGNIRSLVNAVEKCGYEVEWIRSPADVEKADVSVFRNCFELRLLDLLALNGKKLQCFLLHHQHSHLSHH